MRLALALLFIAALSVSHACQAQDITVDLELVLAIDVSRSIDNQEFKIQIRGVAEAFRSPEFHSILQSQLPQGIAVALVQWSGQQNHINVVGWHYIHDARTAAAFAGQIEAAGRRLSPGSTSINNAIRYSYSIMRSNGYQSSRQVIDVSGDGYNNTGNRPELARDEAVALGITINGLTITSEVAQLDRYFRDRVIGGRGAFVMKALNFQDFADVFKRKLIREIIGEKVYSWKQE